MHRDQTASHAPGQHRSNAAASAFGLATIPILAPQPGHEASRPARKAPLPTMLRSGIESLSGLSLGDVRVHYESSRPEQLDADALTQGTDIYIGPGQDEHLPHEAWHVVQQAQGRVRGIGRSHGGGAVNEDATLEREADVRGVDALRSAATGQGVSFDQTPKVRITTTSHRNSIQLRKSLRSIVREKMAAGQPLNPRERALWQRMPHPGQVPAQAAAPAPAQLPAQAAAPAQVPAQGAQPPANRTFYHVSGGAEFAQSLAAGRAQPNPQKHADRKVAGQPAIDPRFVQQSRTVDRPGGDNLRGGDDLGPGFYTSESPAFVNQYVADNFQGDNALDARVLQFDVPGNSFDNLTQQENAPDDDVAFQQNMRDGFLTRNMADGAYSLPESDLGAPAADILSGPINNVDAQTPLGNDGSTEFARGQILRFPNGEVPTQTNFATEDAVSALYDNSTLESLTLDEWHRRHPNP